MMESSEDRRVAVEGYRVGMQSWLRRVVVSAALAAAAAAVSLSRTRSGRESQKPKKGLVAARSVECKVETVRCARTVDWAVAPVFDLEDPCWRFFEIGDDKDSQASASPS